VKSRSVRILNLRGAHAFFLQDLDNETHQDCNFLRNLLYYFVTFPEKLHNHQRSACANGGTVRIPEDAVPDGNTLIAVFAMMRHGDREKEEPGKTTEKGRRQVEASARQHLIDQRFNGVFSSTLLRAKETAEITLAAINHPDIAVETPPAFDLSQLSQNPAFGDSVKRLFGTIKKGATMADWVNGLDENLSPLRACLRNGMFEIAMEYEDIGTPPTFLVGYHGPFAGWAADNSENIRYIGHADVVLYVLSQDRAGNVYFHGSLWKCPPVE